MFKRMGSFCFGLSLFLTLSVAFALQNAAAAPVVTNVHAQQRDDGSGQVDIYYDLTGGIGDITVEMAISNNGGVTWDIMPMNVWGDIGFGVLAGAGKQIIS